MTTKTEQAPRDLPVRPLVAELRQLIATPSDVYNPHWGDEARRLMRRATDIIEAADTVISESYRCNKRTG